MNEVLAVLKKGLHLYSRRGRVIAGIGAFGLTALSAVDALALYLLTNVLRFSSQSESQGVLVNATALGLSLALGLFAVRSIASALIFAVSTRRLSQEQAGIGIRNFNFLLDPRVQIPVSDESNETRYFNAIDRGPENLAVLVMSAASFLSEAISITVILGVFMFLSPLTASVTLLYFCLVVMIQHKVLSRSSARQGVRVQSARNDVYQMLVDSSKLEDVLSESSRISAAARLATSLSRLTRAVAMSQVYASIPRYLLELTFALGLAIVGLTSLLISGQTDSLASLVLFAAIGFRLLPIINRCQVLALTAVAHAPVAQLAILETSFEQRPMNRQPESSNLVFRLSNISFHYSSHPERDVLSDISLDIEEGKQYAIVGPSGSGKSSLARILLGLEYPTRGTVFRKPVVKAAFLPQDTHLAFVSLAENVALLWNRSQIDLLRVERSLRLAGLSHFIDRVHDNAALTNDSISGGEKQRIGLARCFYSDANFIVLDEATSSLDAFTEHRIVETLNELRGQVTTIIIAHRLSTVQHADTVFYMESGQLLGSGTFNSLAADIPKFREQIELGQIDLSE